MVKCAVFASGGGTNFQSLLDRCESGDLHVDFVLCVGNNSKAKAFERAQKHDIPTLHIAPSHFDTELEYATALEKALVERGVEIIVLAGYMKMIPQSLVKKYAHKIINIHPALLPAFGGKGMYGSNVHKAVIEYGAKVSGVTVHFVDEEYDHGPVILQETVPVLDTDTAESLAARVLEKEHDTFWRALELIAQNAIRVEHRRVLRNV